MSSSSAMPQEDLAKCRQIVKNLMSEKYKKYNQLFIEPFPLESVPGYLDVVDKKLDMKTLAANLDAGLYRSRKEFFDDATLIFQNAIKYHSNRETKWISKPAKEMIKVVQRELKNMDKRPSKILTKQRGGSLKLKMGGAGGKKDSMLASKIASSSTAEEGEEVEDDEEDDDEDAGNTKSRAVPGAAATSATAPSSSLEGGASAAAAAAPPAKPKVSLKLKTGGANTKTKEKIPSAKAKPTQPKLKLKISLSKKASSATDGSTATTATTTTTPRPPPSAAAPPASEGSTTSVKSEKSKSQQQIRLSGPRGKELPKGVTAPTSTSTTNSSSNNSSSNNNTKKTTGKAATGKTASTKATNAAATGAKTTTAKSGASAKTTSTKSATAKSLNAAVAAAGAAASAVSVAKTGKTAPVGKTTKKTGTKKTTTKKMKKATATSGTLPTTTAPAPQLAISATTSPTGAASMMTPIRKAQCAKIIAGLKRRKNKSINWFLLPVSDKNIVQDYKAKIKHPMCISTMQNKLDKNEYRNVAQFVLDLRRIFANCLRFNTSMKDRLRTVAVELLTTSEDLLIAFLIRGQNPPVPAGAPDVYPSLLYCWSFCIKVLNTLFNLTNPSDGAPTVLYFLHPVTCYCGGQYPPDYLTLVKKPMDFGTITSNLIEGVYQNVEEFASDCRLVIENCKTFYGGREDGRLFIDHADQLNKVLSQQLDAIDRYLKSPPGLDLKAKAIAKKSPNGPPLFPKPPASVLMQVLEDLRALNYTDKATKITENAMAPFERPVSLADYPDYMQFVQTPMDLQQIERKAKAGLYEMPEDFEYDMTLVFKNCEIYNAHRKGDHLVAMSKYGGKQFRRLFTARMKAFEDPSAVATKEEQKEAQAMSINSNKKVKADPLTGASKGKTAPRISITTTQSTPVAAQAAKTTPKLPPTASSSLSTNKNRAQPVKADQPVPLHIAIARVKEAYPLRRAHKSLQSWEADCARFFKELMRHPWISAARPKFIFHVPVPVLFPELKEAYMMKIRKPMDLTTVECNLLEGNRYSSADDFVQDVALVFSNAITFNKDGRDVGDPLSCAYYDASIHLLRYSRWLSLELLANEIADSDAIDEEYGEGEDKLPPLSWKLTTGNRDKARAEMESLVMNEPIDKSVEGDRFTWMEAECEKLLKALRHQSDLRQMTFFIAANYPADYAAFISKPMDWQKVQTNLKNREYDTFGEICADLRLVFSNALKYNARLKGTDTVSGRAYDAAKYMSAKLEAAIIKMMLSVSDRLERERIDHANAEREIEAAEQAEEARIRATWKKETTTDGTAAPAKADGTVKIKGPTVRMQMKRRESTNFEIPFFDEEDDGQHERSYFDAVKQQKALFERQRQDLAKMRQVSMTTGAAVFARILQRQKATTWLSAMQKLSTKSDPKDEKLSSTTSNKEKNTEKSEVGQLGTSVLTELEKEGRVPVKLCLASLGPKTKKRKRRPVITFDDDPDD